MRRPLALRGPTVGRNRYWHSARGGMIETIVQLVPSMHAAPTIGVHVLPLGSLATQMPLNSLTSPQ